MAGQGAAVTGHPGPMVTESGPDSLCQDSPCSRGRAPDAAYLGSVNQEAQGWYRDPYGLHEDRYFSAGVPTKLVRDAGSESYDEPSARPLPETQLVPAPSADGDENHGSDLRRADEASSDDPYSAEAAKRAAFDVMDSGWPI